MYFCFFLATRSEMLCIDSPALAFFFNYFFIYGRQTDLQIVHQIMAGALAAAIYLLMRKSEFCLHPPLHDLALNLPPSVARAEMATCDGPG